MHCVSRHTIEWGRQVCTSTCQRGSSRQWSNATFHWYMTSCVKQASTATTHTDTSLLRVRYVTNFRLSSCISVPNFVKIAPPTAEIWLHVDFQDGCHGLANLFRASALATALASNFDIMLQSTAEIFWFQKTDGRHMGILLLLSIST